MWYTLKDFHPKVGFFLKIPFCVVFFAFLFVSEFDLFVFFIFLTLLLLLLDKLLAPSFHDVVVVVAQQSSQSS